MEHSRAASLPRRVLAARIIAFAAELLPAVDLAPTWTIAVFLVTRRTGRAGSSPPSVPVEPPLLPP